MKKTGLVVLYNHNYEKNIPIIRSLYEKRFSSIIQLMPFYRGNDRDVVRVHGNSFQFHGYIAQAREHMQQMDCEDYLIIGDDLLLNPEIGEDNVHEHLNVPAGAFYIDGLVNISSGKCYRATAEAHRFDPSSAGLDGTVNALVPSYEEALVKLRAQELLDSEKLSRYTPFYPLWMKPVHKHAYANYKIFKARVFHFLRMLRYKLFPEKMAYPCVFGYSDIVLVPKARLDEWCGYLEVFASWRMFVELAIPTSLMLLPGATVCFASKLKPGNLWYPQNPGHFDRIEKLIKTLTESSGGNRENLELCFPGDYLYLHPVKLSQFR